MVPLLDLVTALLECIDRIFHISIKKSAGISYILGVFTYYAQQEPILAIYSYQQAQAFYSLKAS